LQADGGHFQQGDDIMRRSIISNFAGALLTAALVGAPAAAQAQTATVYGQLGNFDVVNNTGHDAHGFEIELVGLKPADVYYTFSYQRYGLPVITPTATGVLIHWASPYAAGAFTATTIPHAPGTAFATTCYMGGVNYDQAGCEHFGVSLLTGTASATYRWLIEDPQAPGTLIAVDPPVAVAQPYYYIAPPVLNTPPAVVVEVQAPEPAETPEVYGNAQWIKVFVTQLPREVTLDELLTTNPLVVPMATAQTEVNWDILQTQPAGVSGNTNGNRQSRGQKRYQGGIQPTTRSVVRRIELYEYTGAYDPITHEALCADLTCTAPGAGELGDFISAQMTAVNVQADSLTVTVVGNGTVQSGDKVISCSKGSCSAPYVAGTAVMLTAKAGSGSTFTGWTGACAGTGTCTTTIQGAVLTTATFTANTTTGGGGGGGGAVGGTGGGGGGTTTASFTLSVGISNKGTVTSNIGGISCPGTCSAKVPQGSVVVLTATPPAGLTFLGWTGACSGTEATCSVTIAADTKVQANFSK
jgi:hypothetical protein